jgi:hypothetical protein
MIGWIILAAVLAPALVLGRWAERERRRAQARVSSEEGMPPASSPRARRRRPLAGAGRIADTGVRASARPGQPRGRGRSRTYAGR